MTDTESDGDVFDWGFTLNPSSYNNVTVGCRGDVNQAVWFYGQLTTRGVFAAKVKYLYPPGTFDLTVTAVRTDNFQEDPQAVANFITHIGAVAV